MTVAVLALGFISVYGVICSGLAVSESFTGIPNGFGNSELFKRTGKTHFGYSNYAATQGYKFVVHPYGKGSGHATYSNPGWNEALPVSTPESPRSDKFHSNEVSTLSNLDVGEARERPVDTSSYATVSPATNHKADQLIASSKIINHMDDYSNSSTAAVETKKTTFLQQVKSFLTRQFTNISVLIVPAALLLVTFFQYLSKFFFGAVQIYEIMTGLTQRSYRGLDENNLAQILESIASFERENHQKLSCARHLLTCDTSSFVASLPNKDSQFVGSVHKQIRSLIKQFTGNQGAMGRFVKSLFKGSCADTKCSEADLQGAMKLFKNVSNKITSWIN